MRGHAPLLLLVTLTAIGVIVSILQIPLPSIPSGPAWAVAMTLLGGIILLVIKEIGKIRRHDGERIGTRSSDDLTMDREQIRGELNLLAMTARTKEIVERLEESLGTLEILLQRITVTMETAQETQKINTGILETMIRNQMAIEERIQHMPTTADFLNEGERNRHALRNEANILMLGGKLAPRAPEKP